MNKHGGQTQHHNTERLLEDYCEEQTVIFSTISQTHQSAWEKLRVAF